MKKLITIIFLLFSFAGFSQDNYVYYAHALDKLVGADTGTYLYPKEIHSVFVFTLQDVLTKHSGTTATQDTVYVQKSLDGTHWYAYATLHGNTASAAKSTTTAYMTGVASTYIRAYALQTGNTDTMYHYVKWMIFPQKRNFGPGLAVIKLANAAVQTNTVTHNYVSGILSGVYAYAIQIINDSVSGNGTSTCTLETSNDGTSYEVLQTYAPTKSGNIIYESLTGNLGQYVKVKCVHSGTGVDNLTVLLKLYPRADFGSGPPLYVLANTVTVGSNATTNWAYPSQLNGVYGYSVQVAATETSGTASMTCLLQTSNDNTNWTTLQTTGALTDTGTKLWTTVTGDLGRYVRVSGVNSGTGAWTVKATIKVWNKLY
jgi:hypothetical protein